MGEYARYNGQEIKIGTCEDMYYLRADQAHLVSRLPGSLDPNDPQTRLGIRFRFPWPHEDGTEPGHFEQYDKAVHVPGAVVPEGVGHYSVQFVASAGYVTSLPCPESGDTPAGIKIHRNGYRGAVLLSQQKYLSDGRLVPVCECGGCGAAWRYEDQHEIEALAVAFRSEGDRREKSGEGGESWHTVADRILEGAGLRQSERANV